MTCGAMPHHARAAIFAHALAGGTALCGGDETVVIGVKAGEGLLGASLGLSDDHRFPGLHPGHTAMAASGSTASMHRTATTIGAGLAGGVELGTADAAVIIGIQPVETGIGASGHTGLHGRTALIGADGAVAVGVGGGQALHALPDEFGLAESAVAIRVGTHGAGRSVLGERDAGGRGQHQGGQAANH